MKSGIDKSAVNWDEVSRSLDEKGYAVTGTVMSAGDCDRLRECYEDPETRFRSTVDMARYNFGRGQYRYFDYPLPSPVEALRKFFYEGLVPIANEWSARLGTEENWPASHDAFIRRCHEDGQRRPTPLLLKYGKGDYNCLHQDLYGPIHFPLQVIIMLSDPDTDFDGGELMLVEQRPRMQSRAMVVPMRQGAAAVIPVRERPRQGSRGYHRAPMRHGVGEITGGNRHTLGVIFHDAA